MTQTPESAAETARNARAMQLATDIGDLARDIVARLEELAGDVDLSGPEIHGLLLDQHSEFPAWDIIYASWATMFPAAAMAKNDGPFGRLIDRLFREAPKLEDASGKPVSGQSPALPDVQITFKSGQRMPGVLSITPEGTLRLGTPARDPDTSQPILVESFFDISDIEMLSLPRKMPRVGGSLIIPGS